MTDLEETMGVVAKLIVAKRISAHYRISVDDALRNVTRALQYAPELDRVEAIYWYTVGWMESQQSRAAGRTQIGGWLRDAACHGRVTYRGEGEWAAYFGVVFTLKVTERVLTDEEVLEMAIERLEREGYPDVGGTVNVTEAWARGIEELEA